jgi:hypothetical protein
MSDQKISELTALTGANVADTDLLPIVDTSATETKKITFGEFKTALDTATGFVRITGDTMTGNLSFGDNNKAIFGAGSDLQIYHDGSNSYIDDAGSGVLNIRAESYIALSDMSNRVYLTGTSGGAVGLRFNDAQKLATTATGIDVTGNVNLTASGAQLTTTYSGVTASRFYTTTSGANISVDGAWPIMFTNNSTERMRITSTGQVGIGTSSPAFALDVNHASDNGLARFSSGDADAYITISDVNSSSAYNKIGVITHDMYFNTNNSERMRINSSGNVGIGTSSPTAVGSYRVLDLNHVTGGYLSLSAGGSRVGAVYASSSATGLEALGARYIQFLTGNTERMRIDSSGNVGIGVVPSAWGSLWKNLDIGLGASIGGRTDGTQVDIYENLYRDASNAYIYKTAAAGSLYEQVVGNFIWANAGAGTAGATATLTERMRLNSSGNVGIGTTSPATALSIVRSYTGGSDTGYPHIYLNNTAAQGNGSTTFNQAMLRVNAGDGAVGFLRATYDSAGPYGTSIDLWSVSNIPLRFATNNTERMRIDSSGNVGIGTSDPSDIAGGNNLLLVKRTDTANNYPTVYSASAGNAGWRMKNNDGDWVIMANDALRFYDIENSSEAMRIDSSGNLLVGATAVGNGGKLYVNGSISLGTTTTGTQSSIAKDTTQQTASVSTSATTIYTDISSGMSSASAGYFIIYGNDNSSAGFMDVVIAKASGTPVVVSSSTVEGSPPARTYSVSSFALQLTMASGTFNVNLKATVIGHPF